MKRNIVCLLLLLFCACATSNAAFAQATRTWISSVGDDVNPCSRTAPCKTWSGAISKTAAGGEIDALDPGSFGVVFITKAITLDGGPGTIGGILVAGTSGITVFASTDPNAIVVIRNMDINGGPTGSNSLSGIKVIAAGTVIIERCSISQFTGGSPNGYGVAVTPNGVSTLPINLVIRDSLINNNGQLGGGVGIGGGIYFNTPTSQPINALISNVTISGGNDGIVTDYAGGTAIHVTVVNSNIVQTNGVAIHAIAGDINVENSALNSNAVAVQAESGNGATIRLNNNNIYDNLTGIACATFGTGSVASAGNNRKANNTGGSVPACAPNSTITLQ